MSHVIGYMVDMTNIDTTLSEYMYQKRTLYPSWEAALTAAAALYEKHLGCLPPPLVTKIKNKEDFVTVYDDGDKCHINVYKVYGS